MRLALRELRRRPERFVNMLRTLKLTSPMSVGSWILATFVKIDPDTDLPFTVGETFIFSTWLTTVLAAIMGVLALAALAGASFGLILYYRLTAPKG